ncbi:class I SAM-dependent methyltransferase [Dyella sp. GSA-30]|uniref:class I SAM-dependent methyltransferase n=1 Tax=Dyella sp. GSA-30 TaxID=2994496 RepID=UPI0024921A55|nr:class I SAM-dependent methyltransferase [Dyella sp. GSA-30]BDU22249.1 hypothetical protein DYGSA30_37060 [Dyella sp. GSA-30]
MTHSPDNLKDRQHHWESVYQTKAADTVSWYRPHLERSLALIERVAPNRDTAIFDVGGGASTLVDDLLARGYRDLSVLDLSAEALNMARHRLGASADQVIWQVADLLDAPLPAARYDVWHDRAVFHFLVEAEQRAAYVRQLTHALKPGGYAVVATFGIAGPTKCSGLKTAHYDVPGLAQTLGDDFRLLDALSEEHRTPSGTTQSFLYALFQHP